MLRYIRTGGLKGTSAFGYLRTPDTNHNQWKHRNISEDEGYLCDVNVPLTEELKIFLNYFSFKQCHATCMTLESFKLIPVRLV
jgi:hypothetical protein